MRGGGSNIESQAPTGTEGGTPTDTTIGAPLSGTIDSATDVDAFKIPITDEGTLTITTAGTANPNIRVLDATGAEIPGMQGSYVVVITAVILERGGFITIEFYGGTVGQNYTATTQFQITSTQMPPMTDNPTAKAKDAGQLLAEGRRLPVRHIAGVREADAEGRVTQADFDFSIWRNADGQFVVDLANWEHTFTNDELTQHGAWHREDPELDSNTDPDIWWSAQSTDMDNLRAGHSEGDHFIAFRVGREIEEVRGSDPEFEGFAIVGVPTSDFTQRDVTATYNGFALLDLWESSFEPEVDEDPARWESRDVTLVANFTNSSISGQINNLAPEDDPDLGSFSLSMPETDFTTNGFSGDFTTTPENGQDRLTVSFDGSFYGPNAENTAGTMQASGRVHHPADPNDPVSVVGAGWFGATDPNSR